MKSTSLSIIIPAFNEACHLPTCLAEVTRYFDLQPFDYEVIVVDDGSSDRTAEIVSAVADENDRIRLLRLPDNRGKGYAVKCGMLLASGDLRLFADADGSTPVSEVERLLPAITRGAEVVIASRALPDRSRILKTRRHRRVIGTIFNTLVRLIAVRGIHDTQCGFKLFTARAAMALFPLQTIDRFGFDVELLYLCRKMRLPVEEIPVHWSDVSGSRVRLLRDSWIMFFDLLRIRVNDLRGRY